MFPSNGGDLPCELKYSSSQCDEVSNDSMALNSSFSSFIRQLHAESSARPYHGIKIIYTALRRRWLAVLQFRNVATRHSVSHDRPHDPRGHYNLGVCLDALGEGSSALGSFETAFRLQPDMADAGANAAGLCVRRGEAERACTLCYQVSYVYLYGYVSNEKYHIDKLFSSGHGYVSPSRLRGRREGACTLRCKYGPRPGQAP